MAEIRCPMCGSSNPVGSETCQKCQARLTPIASASQPETSLPFLDPSLLNGSDDNESIDWLSSLRSENAPLPDHSEPEQEAPTPAPAEKETEPEWLIQFRDQENKEQSISPTGPLIQTPQGPPEWLVQMRDTAGAEDSASTRDDLYSSQSNAPEENEPPFEKPSPGDNDQDWFLKLSSWQTPVSSPDIPVESEAAPVETTPVWTDETGKTNETSVAPAEANSELPDWLNKPLPDTPGVESPNTAVSAFIEPSSTMPDLPESSQPAEEAATPALAIPADDLPEWLRSIQTESGPAEVSTPIESTPAFFDTSLTEEPIEPIATRDFSWLDQIQESDAFAAENAESELPSEIANNEPVSPVSPFAISVESKPDSSLPDWLGELGSEAAASESFMRESNEVEPAPSMPFKEEDLDWLSSSSAPSSGEGAEGESDSTGEIAPAQLPGWLEAMRPVESYAISAAALSAAVEDDDHIEKAGPLAGFKATLPTESQAFQYHKPPVYSNKLHVSEKQRVQASLLEGLIADSGRSHATSHKGKNNQWIQRLIIASLLILVTAAFLFIGVDSPVAKQAMPTVESIQFANTIEGLPSNTSVLISIDYQPAYDGELHTTITALMQHLMEKKVNIILVSTNPGGPAIGEGLLVDSWTRLSQYNDQSATGYDLKLNTVNLGYLPGGITSLQEFALSPRLAVPAGYRESLNYVSNKTVVKPIWQSDATKDFISINHVSAVIVATDSIDLGRAWIEQVQPFMVDKPLLLIASAQAAPMLRPYVASKQSQGMLTGLNDGLVYQAYLQQPASHSNVIASALNAGITYTILLVLLGAVLQFIRTLIRQTRRKGASS